jgi:hypothetical protein
MPYITPEAPLMPTMSRSREDMGVSASSRGVRQAVQAMRHGL